MGSTLVVLHPVDVHKQPCRPEPHLHARNRSTAAALKVAKQRHSLLKVQGQRLAHER